MTGEGTLPPPVDPGDQAAQQAQDPAMRFAGSLSPEVSADLQATMHRVAGAKSPNPNDVAALDRLAGSIHAKEVYLASGDQQGDEIVMEPETAYSRTITSPDGEQLVEEVDPAVGKALVDYSTWRQKGKEPAAPQQASSRRPAATARRSRPAGKEHAPLTPDEKKIDELLKAMHPGEGKSRTISPADKARLDTLAESVERTETTDDRGDVRYSYVRVETQPDGTVVRTPIQKNLGARLYGHNVAAKNAKGRTSAEKPQPPQSPPRPPQPPTPDETAPEPPIETPDPESADDILDRLEQRLGLKGPRLEIRYGLAETQVLGPDAVLLQQHKLRRPIIRNTKGEPIGYGPVQANHIFGAFNSLQTGTKSSRSSARAAEESARLFLDERQPRTLEEAFGNMQEAMQWASCATGRHGERNNAEGVIGQLLEFDGKQYLIAARSGDGSMAIYRDGIVADAFDGTDIPVRFSRSDMDAEFVVRQLSPGDKVMVVSAGMFGDGDVPRHGLEDIFAMDDLNEASQQVLTRYGLEHVGTANFRQKAALMIEVGDVSQRTEEENVAFEPAGSMVFPRPGADRGFLTNEQLLGFEDDHTRGERRKQPPTRAERGRSAARLALSQLVTWHPVRAITWPGKELKAAKQAKTRERHASVLPGADKPRTIPKGTPRWLTEELNRRGL